jgi:hypothetical protein
MLLMVANVVLLVNCAEPRMDYRTFFELTQQEKFPGRSPDTIDHIISRAVTTMADYADYVEMYRDKCYANQN